MKKSMEYIKKLNNKQNLIEENINLNVNINSNSDAEENIIISNLSISVIDDEYSDKNQNLNKSSSFLREVKDFLIKFSFLLLVFVLVLLTLYFTFYEFKEFQSRVNNYQYILIIIAILSLPSFILIAFLMNTRLGRKYTLFSYIFLILVLRILQLLFKIESIYTYALLRILIISSLIPLNTLLNESFTNVNRLRFISIFNFVFKIFALGIPFLFDNIDYFYYNILIVCISVVVLLCIIALKETKGDQLKD
jgi:hypothetical protein